MVEGYNPKDFSFFHRGGKISATLKAYIAEHGHLPNHHKPENRNLYSWAKYQRKKIKEGTLNTEKRELFEVLLATRSTEHTGGRRKKIVHYEEN